MDTRSGERSRHQRRCHKATSALWFWSVVAVLFPCPGPRAAAILDPPGGFHRTSLTLMLGSDPEGLEVAYTLDGSPATSSAVRYTGPIAELTGDNGENKILTPAALNLGQWFQGPQDLPSPFSAEPRDEG